MKSGTVHLNDEDKLEYYKCEVLYIDNGVIINSKKEGNIFIPYGSIKFIFEK